MSTARARPKIRAPRRTLTAVNVSFESQWEVLSSAIDAILHKHSSDLSFEELYRTAYILVLKRMGPRLYSEVSLKVSAYLDEVVQNSLIPIISSLNSNSASSKGDLNSFTTINKVNKNINDSCTEKSLDLSLGLIPHDYETSQRFLNTINEKWKDHLFYMQMIADVMMYLDRVYAKEARKPTIFEVGRSLFLSKIIQNEYVQDCLYILLLEQIQLDRTGENIDKFLLKSNLNMLQSLSSAYLLNDNSTLAFESDSYYTTSFEPFFLSESGKYFFTLSKALADSNDAPTFLREIKKIFDSEKDRVNIYMAKSTLEKIVPVLNDNIIEPRLINVLKNDSLGIKYLINESKLEDLKLVYSLLSRVDSSQEFLKSSLSSCILTAGEELNQSISSSSLQDQNNLNNSSNNSTSKESDSAQPQLESQTKNTANKRKAVSPTLLAIRWIDRIVELKEKYNTMLDVSFSDNRIIQVAIDSSFAKVINLNPKAAEYLSLYIDDNLKKASKVNNTSNNKSSKKSVKDTEKQKQDTNDSLNSSVASESPSSNDTTDKTPNALSIDAIVDRAILVFRYISDKDLFESYYKLHFAKRLLHSKVVTDELEDLMLRKLKAEGGHAFTTRLEGMFRDMHLSVDISDEYKQLIRAPIDESDSILEGNTKTISQKEDTTTLEEIKNSMDTSSDVKQILKNWPKNISHINFSAMILNSALWPASLSKTSDKGLKLPLSMESEKKLFENYYTSAHTGRVLQWNPALGSVDIRATFHPFVKKDSNETRTRVHEINIPTYGAILLSVFNDHDVDNKGFTYDELVEYTGMPLNELTRHLLSISVAPRTRLLRKEPMSKNISNTDRFFWNDRFDSPLTKIKVLIVATPPGCGPGVPGIGEKNRVKNNGLNYNIFTKGMDNLVTTQQTRVETDEERERTIVALTESRNQQIEAAIVRVMKARGSMNHTDLVGEVTKVLSSRFMPQPSIIKKKIEVLIEREYLERDNTKVNVYRYLA